MNLNENNDISPLAKELFLDDNNNFTKYGCLVLCFFLVSCICYFFRKIGVIMFDNTTDKNWRKHLKKQCLKRRAKKKNKI